MLLICLLLLARFSTGNLVSHDESIVLCTSKLLEMCSSRLADSDFH